MATKPTMTGSEFQKMIGKKKRGRKRPPPLRMQTGGVCARPPALPMAYLVLPLPAKCLRGNAKPPTTRGGHIGLANARKNARRIVGLLLNGHHQPRWARAEYELTWVVTNASHQPDEDNAVRACKSYLDGLQDAGVILNDKGLRKRSFTNEVGEAEGVIIRVFPVKG